MNASGRKVHSTLMWKFLLVYFCIAFFGIAILELSNLFILGSALKFLLEFNFAAVFLEGLAGVLFLQAITAAGLGNTRKLLKGLPLSGDGHYKAWKEMVSFPGRIFTGMAVFGVAASVIYHASEYLRYHDPIDSEEVIRLVYLVSFEQTLSLILAILLSTGSRRLLRRYVMTSPIPTAEDLGGASFYKSQLVISACLLLITVLDMIWYVLQRHYDAKPINITIFLCIAFFDVIFGFCVILLFTREMRDEFRVLLEAMGSLLTGSRSKLKTKVPIVAANEIGSLGLIFNRLQEKVTQEYDEVEAELRLAWSIQKKLLPEGERVFGHYTAAGVCRPCREVGGDFFDIIPQDEEHFIAVIGDVTGKGMPAALVMSAMLLLFRNEAGRGGTASGILERLNRMAAGTGVDEICLTLAVAVFDTAKNEVQYAAGGHVAPYIKGRGGIRQLASSSLPLGLGPEETYTQEVYSLEPGDSLIMYTDGLADDFGESRASGFEAFEEILAALDVGQAVSNQLDFILKMSDEAGRTGHDDDKTLLIIRNGGLPGVL